MCCVTESWSSADRLPGKSIWRLALGALFVCAAAPSALAQSPANGWVVWASDREGGRHEIYRMKADGSAITRLTDQGGKFPTWAPDGKWIAYNDLSERGRVMRPDGSASKQVCADPFRFWLHDGGGLVCGKAGDFHQVDPDTGSKKLLFRKADFQQVKNSELNPSGMTADRRYIVAHTDLYRKGYGGSNGSFKHHHAAIVLDTQDKSKVYYFGGGCEPTTPPSGNLIYHVCGGSDCPHHPDIARMQLSDLGTRKSYAVEVSHRDSDWGHEYFPRVSTDSKWMVYGASTGCHDHDTCDYEIFVHSIGAASASRRRITQHKANDQWPHLYIGTLAVSGCTSSAECDDGAPCTSDTCVANKCQHTPVAGCCTKSSQCDDADPCTADHCSANACSNETISGCCKADADCDDGNKCTADVCDANKCRFSSVKGCCASAADCDDGNTCTTDRCRPSDGSCTFESAPGCCAFDVDCDDANACTIDRCQGNGCVAEPLDACCTIDLDCDDGDLCTADRCQQGSCERIPLSDCPGGAGPAVEDAGPAGQVDDGAVGARPTPAGQKSSAELLGGCAVGGSGSGGLIAILLLASGLWRRRRPGAWRR